jgi:hypothetical protein
MSLPSVTTATRMKKIPMAELAGSNVLAKAAAGRTALRKLLEVTEAEPNGAAPAFLDFTDVDAATSSFLRECVLGFRDATRMRRSHFYPVISNADEGVEDELNYLLAGRGEAMLACDLSRKNKVTRLHLLGQLDPKHRQTFDLVMHHGETDAGSLMRDYGEDEAVTRTAWNNRLATLSSMGLVIEVSHGRAKRYMPVLQET